MDNDFRGTEGFISLNRYRQTRTTTMIHSELRALHSYWDGLRAGRKTPFRAEIDPRDMTCDARNLFILEDLGRGNIRFRLAGSAIVDAFGMELRGMSARSVMSNAARESFIALISETLEEPGVGYARLSRVGENDEQWEVLLLPLRSDFGDTNRVIGCLLPVNGAAKPSPHAPLRFVIDHMSVEGVQATVHETGSSAPLSNGFGEPAPRFDRKPSSVSKNNGLSRSNAERPRVIDAIRLHAIEGGLAGTAPEAAAEEGERPRRRPNLRIVED